uniref:Uncharacterized protein n=1 Tax=Octopus bimaculoides TaxID=37653 RepID=A0A0L8HHV8_OCTBM
MELPIDATAKCEVRVVIWFLNAKGIKLIEIHRRLTEVHGELCMNVKNVRKWCKEFEAGHRRITLDDLRILVPQVSRSTIHKLLSEKLQRRKVCATWVPRMLTEDHKQQPTL